MIAWGQTDDLDEEVENMLELKNITYHIGGRTLLEGASLTLPAGHKAALIGRNGAGKTTLFKLILGLLQPDRGDVLLGRGQTVATVAQETPFGDLCPLDFLLDSHEEYKTLMAAAEVETDPTRISEIHERLEAIDAYDAPARASKILYGLGFSEEDQLTPLHSFSGGWRMRVSLAAVLFLAPDILLLDEPSNHLDLETTLWLTQYLKSYRGSVLLISHDKHFINAVVDRIFHLSHQTITSYVGNYDAFQEKRFEQMIQQQASFEKQQAQREHLKSFIDRFRAGTRAKQAQSRVKALGRLEEIHLLQDDASSPLEFPNPPELAPPMLSFENASLGYGDHIILSKLNQSINPGDRIALLGRNGNGKTTFASAVGGQLKPLKGTVKTYQNFKTGFFQQHQIESLNPALTPFETMGELMEGKAPSQVRAFLGRFGFPREKADVKIASLSGGEKTRLMFSILCHQQPALLILDEPTNHLDIETRESLILALNAYTGAVLLITHDWDLLEMTGCDFWLVEGGHVTPFDGTLQDYQSKVLGITVNAKDQDQKRKTSMKQKKRDKKK